MNAVAEDRKSAAHMFIAYVDTVQIGTAEKRECVHTFERFFDSAYFSARNMFRPHFLKKLSMFEYDNAVIGNLEGPISLFRRMEGLDAVRQSRLFGEGMGRAYGVIEFGIAGNRWDELKHRTKEIREAMRVLAVMISTFDRPACHTLAKRMKDLSQNKPQEQSLFLKELAGFFESF